MKGIYALILAFLLLMTACSQTILPEESLRLAQETMREGSFPLQILTEDGEEASVLLICEEGQQILQFEEPLAGLSFICRNSVVEISMDGISEKLPAGALLDSSAAAILFEALDALAAAEALALEEDGELLQLDYGRGILLLDREGRLRGIEAALTIHFPQN